MWILNKQRTMLINTDKIMTVWLDSKTCSIKCRCSTDASDIVTLGGYNNAFDAKSVFNLVLNAISSEKTTILEMPVVIDFGKEDT